MSYLARLTEQYDLYIQSEDVTTNGALKTYLESLLPTDFCEAVFVIGMELRDEDDIHYTKVKRVIEIVEEVYKEKKLEDNDKRHAQYILGLTGMYLNPCTIDTLTKQIIESDLLETIVFNLKTCLQLLEDIKPSGVLLYQTMRQYEYVYACLDKLKVFNNNIPPDLDSIYVFTDAFNTDDIWYELIRQNRDTVQSDEPNTTDIIANELYRMSGESVE